MRIVAPTVCKALGIRPPSSAESSFLAMAGDSMGVTERLAVIVLDALGMSTWKKGRSLTPTLNKLEAVHGTVIRSVMQSVTAVNFATMLMGASPDIHGVTARESPIVQETVFDVMREAGLRSATAARAFSSLGIRISPHSDTPGIAESNLDSDVTGMAVKRLSDGYNLVWVQFLGVDDAGHKYGPLSDENMEFVATIDENLRTILEAARDNGYTVIVLADHGQHESGVESHKGDHGTDMPEDIEAQFLWAGNDELKRILGKQ